MIDVIAYYVIPAALALLPTHMDTPAARAMLVAIGLQESRFLYRRQVQGPARGFWQFEAGGGVRGVLTHPTSRPHALTILELLRYPVDADTAMVHQALEHNDLLACCFARLLLTTLPDALPASVDMKDEGWRQYLAAWRPGAPHRQTWDNLFVEAWQRTDSTQPVMKRA